MNPQIRTTRFFSLAHLSAIFAICNLATHASLLAQCNQDQANNVTSLLYNLNIWGDWKTAQTFTAGVSGNLCQTRVEVTRTGDVEGWLIAEIQGVSAQGRPDGNVYASAQFPPSGVNLYPNMSLITFDFSAANVRVTAGQKYAIVLKSPSASAPNWYLVRISSNNGYQGGDFYYGYGGGPFDSWSGAQGEAGHDTTFKTWIVPTTNITISAHQVPNSGFQANSTDGIDAPLEIKANTGVLSALPNSPVFGLVADGVTPLLFKLNVESGVPPIPITVSLSFNSGGLTNAENVNDHFQVLQGSQWVTTTNFSITSTNEFACLTPFRSEDLILGNNHEASVTLTARAANGSVIATNAFRIRKPPIVLVHGYNATSSTWSDAFLATLISKRPVDSIRAITYAPLKENTEGNLVDLADDLDQTLQNEIENKNSGLLSGWACTRYDIVGHSQGGVITRMLCQNYGPTIHGIAPYSSWPVVSSENCYRGRFRRVITIGSPHNGSTLLYYILTLESGSDSLRYSSAATLIREGAYWKGAQGDVLQRKFDPFGSQIQQINNPANPVDPRIRFHCVSTRIDGSDGVSQTYCNLSYLGLGLCGNMPSQQSQRASVLLPLGSDGVVNSESHSGGIGTHATLVGGLISHSAPELGFGVAEGSTQTASPIVASDVMRLLDGTESEFGSFYLPVLLSQSRKAEIDEIIPDPTFDFLIRRLTAPSSLVVNATGTNTFKWNSLTTDFRFALDLAPGDSAQGDVSWFVEVFGTNGVTTIGVSWRTDTNDNKTVTVSVDDSVVGDVVLYGSYLSTNGNLVVGYPVVVVSRPAGLVMSGISLSPTNVSLSVGDKMELGVWGVYTNGFRSRLFLPPNSPLTITSTSPTVVEANTNLVITLKARGSATVTATYNGFTAQTLVASNPAKIDALLGQIGSNGLFQVTLKSTAGFTNVIEVSTNLVNWTPIFTALNTNGLLQFYDSGMSNVPCRFYRAVVP